MILPVLNLSLIATVAATLLAVIARIEYRERRFARMESDVKYLRRDLDQLLRLYRLTPVEEQERRRRR